MNLLRKTLGLVLLCLIAAHTGFAQTTPSVVTMQNAATATGNGTAIIVGVSAAAPGANLGAVGIQITGSFTATITFEATTDGTNWTAVMATELADDSRATTATAAGHYTILYGSAIQVRARISAYTGGTITIKGRLIPGLTARLTSGGGGGGSGTVTDFSAGDLSPLFTTTETDTTTTPALSFSLTNAAAHKFFGNNTGSTGAPAYVSIGTGDLPTGIPNANLANSGFTLGSTAINLGDTATTIAGLTLTTPTIADFSNATHNHSNAAGGGQVAIGSGISGLGTGVATFLGTPSSANFLSAISDETGSGLAMGNNTPTIITPSFTTGFTIGGTAATGTIPRGNGTNFVASSFTMAAPGTSGNVLTSDGTNWTSAAPASAGANTALSNLASVSINASLIPQTTLDLGAAATAWRDIYFYGAGTFGSHSIKLTGTPTGNRTATFPDNTGTVAELNLAQTFTANQAITSTVTTGTGTSSGFSVAADSLTTGTGANFASSSVTSGSVVNIASTSTAAASSTLKGLNIAISGANSTTAQTVTGASISVTNTNATSGTNIALAATASGATTANYAAVFTGLVALGGTASSFPAIKRNGSTSTTAFRSGDDSGYAAIFTAATYAVDSSTNLLAYLDSGIKGLGLAANGVVVFSNTNDGATATKDLTLRRAAAANLAFGAADAASPVAQTMSVQNVVAGTSNTAGASWTHAGSRGTGTGVGGDIIFQTAPAGSSGTSQNALAAAFTVKGEGTVELKTVTFANLPTVANARLIYCSDCTIASPCASGGSGALAKGINGAWVCN